MALFFAACSNCPVVRNDNKQYSFICGRQTATNTESVNGNEMHDRNIIESLSKQFTGLPSYRLITGYYDDELPEYRFASLESTPMTLTDVV